MIDCCGSFFIPSPLHVYPLCFQMTVSLPKMSHQSAPFTLKFNLPFSENFISLSLKTSSTGSQKFMEQVQFHFNIIALQLFTGSSYDLSFNPTKSHLVTRLSIPASSTTFLMTWSHFLYYHFLSLLCMCTSLSMHTYKVK